MEVSIITGGSSGLGFELARVLMNRGSDVIVVGKTQAKVVNAVRALCDEHGLVCISTMGIGPSFYCMGNGKVSVAGIVADVSSEGEAERIFDFAASSGREVSALINCAGSRARCDAKDVDGAILRRALDDNATGLALMCSAALKFMKKGIVVNVMSSAALKGNAGEVAYCGAKWAARGYHEAFKAAAAGGELRFLAVYPSGMKTPFWDGCGDMPDVSKFMEPAEVAEIVADALKARSSLSVSELIIEKK